MYTHSRGPRIRIQLLPIVQGSFPVNPKNNAIENSNYGSKKIENQFIYLNILGSFKKYISIK